MHMVNDVIVLFRIMKSRSNVRTSKRKISIQIFFILTKEIISHRIIVILGPLGSLVCDAFVTFLSGVTSSKKSFKDIYC